MYEDIINMEYKKSAKHPHMSLYDRAAQFSPFAALTGHDAAIEETARLTDSKIELDECEKTLIDEKLQNVAYRLNFDPEISVTYFLKDMKKSGGAYFTHTGTVKRIDEIERLVVFVDKMQIPIDDILEIEILDK